MFIKNIGIVGSRRRNSKEDYFLVLDAFKKIYYFGDVIISGGCSKGADQFAQQIADELKVKIINFLPDKNHLDKNLLLKNPRAAYTKINYERNEVIALYSDFLIACVASNRKGGTENTIKYFLKIYSADRLILV